MADFIVDCGESLTICEAGEFLDRVRCVPADALNVTLRTDTLVRIDTAGAQLLVALFKDARERGATASCTHPSAALMEACRLLGLSDELGLSHH
ncbi:MAG: STAS domain-containing protein [Gammaproteobacteria bacterium]|nr:STAS domain-containing protein [Gammaproteobacteria bacterium]